ncbi:hypothetical protein ADIS_0739 [Lunatimonas lonarensis]|uniref:Uncharacterized protein n=1 Tax=Lunatimonas lonarensis TaxID=1232681 RepID=R7ZXP6_9BACT|nr:hypothetical protein ADIS_0739 [Lunatimonas lonarensis]
MTGEALFLSRFEPLTPTKGGVKLIENPLMLTPKLEKTDQLPGKVIPLTLR